ncbi:hypothetical protein Hanom_Chr03g00265161 [Helianthus anomalus]
MKLVSTVGDPSPTSHSNPNFSTSTTHLPKSPKHLSLNPSSSSSHQLCNFNIYLLYPPSTYSLHI